MYPEDLREFNGALLVPQPLTIHKPTQNGTGTALKLNTRLAFEWGHTDPEPGQQPVKFLKRTRGGLFVDFAKQNPGRDDKGHATFAWADQKSLVTAKLGL